MTLICLPLPTLPDSLSRGLPNPPQKRLEMGAALLICTSADRCANARHGDVR